VPVDSDGGSTPVMEYAAGPGAGCVSADDRTLALLANHTLVERNLDSGVATTVTLPGPSDTRYLLLAGQYTVVMTSSVDDAGAMTLHVNAVTTGTPTVKEVASFPWTNVLAMAADANGIYWSPQSEARIDGCSDVLCTAGTRHFTPSLTPWTLNAMALDPLLIYVSQGGNGTVVKFAR
jgi:hypothetical protein